MATEMRLIDANAFREFLEVIRQDYREEDTLSSGFAACLIETVQDEYLALAPTIDAVEVVHGEWIHCQGKSNLWYCSACGEKILYNPTRRTYNIAKRPVHEVNKYCRGCGAKMEGEKDDGKAD